MKPQRGFALLEALAAIAIAALGAGLLFAALSAAAKIDGGPQQRRRAAARLAAQVLRVAEDAWKYGMPGEAPAGSTTAMMPVPDSGTAVPVTIASEIASQTPDGAAITVTVSYPPEQRGTNPAAVTVSGALHVKAPLPGARVERPDLIPQPAATP